ARSCVIGSMAVLLAASRVNGFPFENVAIVSRVQPATMRSNAGEILFMKRCPLPSGKFQTPLATRRCGALYPAIPLSQLRQVPLSLIPTGAPPCSVLLRTFDHV